MSLRQQMEEAHRLRKQVYDVSHQRYLEASRRRLGEILEKKLRTTFIGAISAIEESAFGRLWGHGLRPEERTADQQKWYDVWQQVRTKILNNGNNQLRAVHNELSLYQVEWLRYRTVLPVIPPQEEA